MSPRLEALETRLTPAAATHLAIIYPPPSTVIAGQAFGLTVVAEDGLNNVDTTYGSNVVLGLASNPGGGALGGTTTGTIFKGVVTFTGLTLNMASGGYQIQVASGDLPLASTPVFTVTAATATQVVVTSPPPATVAAGQTFGLTVAVEDQYGNVATSFTGNLAVAPTNSALEGTLGGVLTAAVSNGQATFSGLSLVKSGTPFTLQVSATGLPSATTSPFSVMAATAVQLAVVSPPPTSVGAGVGFGLTIAAEDPYGNVDSSYPGTVAVSLAANPGQDTLVGVATLPLSGGLATFAGLSLTKAASGYVLQAACTGLTSPAPSTLTISVTPGAPAQLVMTTPPPTTLIAGTPFGMVIAAEDLYGNIAPSNSGNVALALATNPGGSTLGGATTAAFNNGLATFNQLTLTKAGVGYTLLATSSGGSPKGLFNGLSLTVTPAAASQLVVTSEPPPAVAAGQAFEVTVTVEDPYGNRATAYQGSLPIAPADAGRMGNLGGALVVPVVGGVATFSGLSLVKAGTPFTLQVSAAGLATVTTSPFVVTADAATRLVVISPPPSTVTAGVGFGLQVAAEDDYGNVDTTFAQTVAVGLAPGSAQDTLVGTTKSRFSAGLATFAGLTLTKAGPGYLLQATSTGLTPTAPSTLAFSIKAGAAGQLVPTSPPPSTITAGVPFSLVLAAEDQYGNVDAAFVGSVTVALAINPGGAMLSGTTNVPFSNGQATFAGLSLNKSGSGYTLMASSSGLSPATIGFGVSAAAVTQLVASVPATVTAGQAVMVKVIAEDAFGNIVTTFGGNLSVLGLAGAGTWVTGSAFNGAVAFEGPTYDKAGVYSLSIQGKNDDGSLNVTATQTIAVTSARATQLVLTSPPPSEIAAGSPFGLVLAAGDPYGNVDPTFAGSVTVALGNNPGGGALAGTANVSFSNGLATFTGLTLNKVGSGYTLLASSQGLSPATAMFDVTPRLATQLVVTSRVPKAVTANSAFGLTIAAEDSSGNVDPTFTGSVTVALGNNPDGGILGGTTVAQFSNGLASFTNLTISKAGLGYTLLASSSGLAPPPSSDLLTFDVMSATTTGGTSSGTTTTGGTSSGTTTTGNPSSAADLHLVVSGTPGTVVAGGYFPLSVTVADATGAPATSYTGKVTLALADNPGGAVLGGNVTMTVSHGKLTFYGLTVNVAGSGYTIRATGNGFAPAISSPITVVSPPAQLVVTSPPPPAVANNRPFDLTVAVADAFGDRARGYSGDATITLIGRQGGVVLHGPRTVGVVDGVARFTGLRLARARPGASYTLRVTASGLTAATTGSFIVSPAPAHPRHAAAR